jgi:hypothetical protein
MKQNIHYFIQKLNPLHICVRNVVLFKISKYTHTLYAYVAHSDTKETRMKEIPGNEEDDRNTGTMHGWEYYRVYGRGGISFNVIKYKLIIINYVNWNA